MRRAVGNARHRHSVIDFYTCGLSPTACLCLDVALDALERCVCQEKVDGRPCVPGNEFDTRKGCSDGCRAFFLQVQVCQVPVNLVGGYLAFVESRGDLHKCLVDVAAGFRGLLDLFAPVQEVRGHVTIDPFGIESNGLKLKRLRTFGQWPVRW